MPLPEPPGTPYLIPPQPHEVPYKLWELIGPSFRQDGVTLTESFPHDTLRAPVIVWRLSERYPGREGRERLKPRLRMSKFSLDGTRVIEYYAQWNTCIYEFSVVTRSIVHSLELLSRLEDEILYAIPQMKERYGIDEIIFMGCNSPYILGTDEEQIAVATIRYRVILERVHRIEASSIQRIRQQGYAGSNRAVDIPVVRDAESNRDLLPHNRVVLVEAAFDHPYLSDMMVDENTLKTMEWPDEWQPYLSGVDFMVVQDSSGVCYVQWLPGRRNPEPGSTYYITYWYAT